MSVFDDPFVFVYATLMQILNLLPPRNLGFSLESRIFGFTLPNDARHATTLYRVTNQVVQNLQLTSKQKFRFGLTWPGLDRPKRNFCFEVNGRFCTTRFVSLYMLGGKKSGLRS